MSSGMVTAPLLSMFVIPAAYLLPRHFARARAARRISDFDPAGLRRMTGATNRNPAR